MLRDTTPLDLPFLEFPACARAPLMRTSSSSLLSSSLENTNVPKGENLYGADPAAADDDDKDDDKEEEQEDGGDDDSAKPLSPTAMTLLAIPLDC